MPTLHVNFPALESVPLYACRRSHSCAETFIKYIYIYTHMLDTQAQYAQVFSEMLILLYFFLLSLAPKHLLLNLDFFVS